MACQICGRRSAPGAQLCADCSAARKRAYDTTITQPLVMAGARTLSRLRRAARGGTRSRSARKTKAVAPALPAASVSVAAAAAPGWNRHRPLLWALLAAGVTIAAIAGWYLPSHSGVNLQTEAAPPSAATTAAPPPVASVPPPPVQPASQVPSPATVPPLVEQEPPVALHPEAKPAPKRAAAAPVVTPPATEAPPPVQIVRLPRPAVVAAPPPPAPRPDPWQEMKRAIEGCPSDGFLAHLLCEQRVRLQYCEGHWGQVAQCPGGPGIGDHR